ncbi:MAG: PDZ domain-containing protein [Planctomycetota bacterium]|nr:MAG: PDZ domain-containing protein [Planctomycetota bacterium]
MKRNILVAAAVIVVLGAAAFLIRKPTGVEDTPAKAGTRQIDPTTWVVSRADQQAYLGDPARVSRQITTRPTPGKEEGSVTDLTIVSLAEDSPMHAAGFRTNDRILKVNGTPIGTLGRALNLLQEIKSGDRLTVQVQRGERILDYKVDFE